MLLLLIGATLRANVVDVTPKRGDAITSINWTDDAGRTRTLTELSGYPVILLPIYTRCSGPCLQTVDRLKSTLANSSADPRQFRVLLFSFDSRDTAAALEKYRQRETIPLSWLIGSASQSDTDALLQSIGIQVGRAGTEFAHPNILVFLDPNLRVARWIYGTSYSSADIDLALKVAGGGNDWIGEHSQLLYSLLLFAGSLLCVALCYSLSQLRSRRDSRQVLDRIPPIVAEH